MREFVCLPVYSEAGKHTAENCSSARQLARDFPLLSLHYCGWSEAAIALLDLYLILHCLGNQNSIIC